MESIFWIGGMVYLLLISSFQYPTIVVYDKMFGIGENIKWSVVSVIGESEIALVLLAKIPETVVGLLYGVRKLCRIETTELLTTKFVSLAFEVEVVHYLI